MKKLIAILALIFLSAGIIYASIQNEDVFLFALGIAIFAGVVLLRFSDDLAGKSETKREKVSKGLIVLRIVVGACTLPFAGYGFYEGKPLFIVIGAIGIFALFVIAIIEDNLGMPESPYRKGDKNVSL